MNNLSSKVFLMLFLGSSTAAGIVGSPSKDVITILMSGNSAFSLKVAQGSEPKKITRAKKKQQNNKKKLDRDYKKSIKRSQKRSYDIQSPEVKERMKQNKKNTVIRDKERKKKSKENTRKGAKKYN